MTAPQCLDWVARLCACSLLVQTGELWFSRDSFSERGIYREAELHRELVGLPSGLRALLSALLRFDLFLILLKTQLALAVATLLFGCSPLLLLSFLIALLVCVRFRGSYNGGSDSMTLLTLLSLALAGCIPNPTVQRACVYYIAVQTCLSYFLAGVVKIKEPSWRSGSALVTFVRLQRYAVPQPARRWLEVPWLAGVTSTLLVTFECTFPFALWQPRWALIYLALGLCFHLANSWLFGLNRFLWAWAATYPAVWFVSQ